MEDRLYYIDITQRKLFRVFRNGTNLEDLIWHGMPGAEGIAIDWIGRWDILPLTNYDLER